MISSKEIESVGKLSVAEFHREFLLPQVPVVISGGIADWPAFKLWTDDYLVRFSGDEKVTVKSKSDYSGGESKRECEVEGEVALRNAIRYMASDDPSDLTYVRETRILEKIPKLRKDVVDPPYIAKGTHPSGPFMWIGPSGTKAQLHWDPWHNLFGQLRGRKKFILIPHEQLDLTYPNLFDIDHASKFDYLRRNRPEVIEKMREAVMSLQRKGLRVNRTNYRAELSRHLDRRDVSCLIAYLHDINNCHVDAEHPDLDKHPLFEGTQRLEFDLEAGDLLFIPYCHLHYVRSLDPSISINWFFDPVPEERDMHPDLVRIALQHLEAGNFPVSGEMNRWQYGGAVSHQIGHAKRVGL